MIDVAWSGDACRITLNRPEKANALNHAMLADLADAAAQARDARVTVLTGTGKTFSAGADIGDGDGIMTDPLWQKVSDAIAALRGLTIAALNGTLAGGAFGMALACDLRVAVPGAKLFYPVMARGVLPQPPDPGRLRALVGPARAKLLLMTGARFSAEEARQIGLIDRVAEDLEGEVAALSRDVLSADAGHVARIKAMVDGAG